MDQKLCCFVTSCDSNTDYFKGALALIRSIRCFSNFPIVFLDAGLKTKQVEEISLQVDEVICPEELLRWKEQKIKHRYLNPSMLASLYLHYTNYSKVVYLDVDTIILDNIDFIFEYLKEYDLVAVRAGIINYLKNGKLHKVKDEIDEEIIESLQKIVPNLKLENIAFNTGCFGINTLVFKEWENYYKDLVPLLTKMNGDQSIFNLLVSASNIKVKEISYEFNLGGSSQSLQEKNDDFRTIIHNGRPVFLYKGSRIVVPHFSGRPKPWEVDNNSPGKQIWNYFAEENAMTKKLSPNMSTYKALSHRRELAKSASKLDPCWKNLSPVEIRDAVLQKAKLHNLSDFVETDYGFGKFLMFSNNDDYVSLRNFWTGGPNYEFSSIWLFSYFAKNSKNIIDVGAYTGVFSLAASVANPNSSIYTFEPIQEIFARLTMNIQANLFINIFPYNYALYNKKSYQKINYFASGQGLLRTGQSLKSKVKEFNKTFVPTIQLDNLLNMDSISLIKLDAEDSELECLKGSRKNLKNSEPVIIIECQNYNKFHTIRRKFFPDKFYLYKFINDCPSNMNLFFEKESKFWDCKHSRNILIVPKSQKNVIPDQVY